MGWKTVSFPFGGKRPSGRCELSVSGSRKTPIFSGSLWLTCRHGLLLASDTPKRCRMLGISLLLPLIVFKHTPSTTPMLFKGFWDTTSDILPVGCVSNSDASGYRNLNRDFYKKYQNMNRSWFEDCIVVQGRNPWVPRNHPFPHSRSQRFSWDGLLRMMVRARMLPHLQQSTKFQTQIEFMP